MTCPFDVPVRLGLGSNRADTVRPVESLNELLLPLFQFGKRGPVPKGGLDLHGEVAGLLPRPFPASRSPPTLRPTNLPRS